MVEPLLGGIVHSEFHFDVQYGEKDQETVDPSGRDAWMNEERRWTIADVYGKGIYK